MSPTPRVRTRFKRLIAGTSLALGSLLVWTMAGGAITVSGGVIGGFEQDGNLVFDGMPGATTDWVNAAGVVKVIDDTLDSGVSGKENDPEDWTCNTGGANPGKGNILRAYLNQRTVGGDAFLDLAWVRQNGPGDGDTHLNFEFSQLAQTDPCIMNRAEGDLLITYDFPGGTTNPDIMALLWDAGAGEWSPIAGFNGSVVKAAVNTTAALSDVLVSPAVSVDAGRFGEATINLSGLLSGAGSQCSAFGTANIRSRTSGESFNAALSDRLPGTAISISTCGSITITKDTDPDAADDFTFQPSANLNGGEAFVLDDDGPDGSATPNSRTFAVRSGTGPHSVEEQVAPGYTLTAVQCTGDVDAGVDLDRILRIPDLDPDESVECVFTNRAHPRLTVVKTVVNDDGGTASSGDFTMNVAGNNVSDPSFPGAGAPGTTVTLNPGSYTVSETGPAGYAGSFSAGCSGAIEYGDHKTCTITNDDQPATLTVIKVVVNNDGGTASVPDFPLFVDGNQVVSGQPNAVGAGPHTVSETNQPGYTPSIGGDCNPDGTINLALGQNATCTITNDDQRTILTVIKHLINDDGGTLAVPDFPLFIDGNQVDSGFPNPVTPGPHVVQEFNRPGYTATISGDCNPDGTINLALGDNATCIITNDDVRPPARTGTIVVMKDTDPDGSRNFTFLPSAGVNNGQSFQLDDDDNPNLPNSRTFTVAAGSHTVRELDDSTSYDLTKIVCDDSDSSGDIATGTATYVVDADETVTCTFTNKLVYDQYPGDPGDDYDDDYGQDPDTDPTYGTDPTDPTPAIDPETDGEVAGQVKNAAPAPDPSGDILGNDVVQMPPANHPVAAAELPRTGSGLVVRQALLGVVLLGAGLLATLMARRRTQPSEG